MLPRLCVLVFSVVATGIPARANVAYNRYEGTNLATLETCSQIYYEYSSLCEEEACSPSPECAELLARYTAACDTNVPCEPGTVAVNLFTCWDCLYYSYSSERNAKYCDQCPAGSRTNADGTGCEPCPGGQCNPCSGRDIWTGRGDTCEQCTGALVPDADKIACVACPDGTRISADYASCEACPDGNCTIACGTGHTRVYDIAAEQADPQNYDAWVEVEEHQLGASETCFVCPDHSYGWNGDLPPTCSPCAEGTYAELGDLSCKTCPAGFASREDSPRVYHVDGFIQCVSCADELGVAAEDAFAGGVRWNGGEYCFKRCGEGERWRDDQCEQCPQGKSSDGAQWDCCDVSPSCPLRCGNGTVSDFVFNETTYQWTEVQREVPRHELPDEKSCLLCPSGKAWNGEYDIVMEWNGPNVCEYCSVGMYVDIGGLECQTCPSGYYNDPGDMARVSCSSCIYHSNYYNYYQGLNQEDFLSDGVSCWTPCPIGHYDFEGTCTPCPTGTVSDGTRKECVACEGDLLANEENGACVAADACPPGTFSHADTHDCIACPEWTYTNVSDSTACSACPPGYQANADGTGCETCPAHEISTDGICAPCLITQRASADHTTCIDCSSGRFSYGDTCEYCPDGHFAGPEQCEVCPEGYTKTDFLPNSCEECPSGYYALRNYWSCYSCSNFERPNATRTGCEECPVGFVNPPDQPDDECSPCAPGTVRPHFEVVGIDENGYQQHVGGTCTPCYEDTDYQDEEGQATCKTCPPGKHNPSTTATVCADCPAGKYGSGGVCSDCSAGKTSSAGAGVCVECGVATESDAGGGCTACPTASSTEGLDGVISMDPYTERGVSASQTCLECPLGKFKDTDGVACQTCPAGFINDRGVGEGWCSPCPERHSSDAQRIVCSLCQQGKYADPTTGACEECPIGRVGAYAGVCSACPMGQFTTGPGKAASTESNGLPNYHQCSEWCPAGVGVYPEDYAGQDPPFAPIECRTCQERRALVNGVCQVCDIGFVFNDTTGLCDVCPAGYTTYVENATACVPNCDCPNGVERADELCEQPNGHNCASCDMGYRMETTVHYGDGPNVTLIMDPSCEINVCTCDHGVGATGEEAHISPYNAYLALWKYMMNPGVLECLGDRLDADECEAYATENGITYGGASAWPNDVAGCFLESNTIYYNTNLEILPGATSTSNDQLICKASTQPMWSNGYPRKCNEDYPVEYQRSLCTSSGDPECLELVDRLIDMDAEVARCQALCDADNSCVAFMVSEHSKFICTTYTQCVFTSETQNWSGTFRMWYRQITGCTDHGDHVCASCDDGYFLNDANTCSLKQCTCANGPNPTGTICPTHEATHCTTCDSYFALADNECVRDSCPDSQVRLRLRDGSTPAICSENSLTYVYGPRLRPQFNVITHFIRDVPPCPNYGYLRGFQVHTNVIRGSDGATYWHYHMQFKCRNADLHNFVGWESVNHLTPPQTYEFNNRFVFLDRHNIDCQDHPMSDVRQYDNSNDGTTHFGYTCHNNVPVQNCKVHITSTIDLNDQKQYFNENTPIGSYVLSHTREPDCSGDKALTRFQLRTVHDNTIYWEFTCCEIVFP